MKPIRPALLTGFALAALAFTGCTPTLDIAVDGYTAPGAHPAGKYAVAPANPLTDEGDLRFKAFAGELESVLAAKGWTRVADRKDAATLIRFGYGVSGPINDIREYDRPEFGVTGYALSRNVSPGPNGTVVSSFTQVPLYGQTGYSRGVDARIVYTTSVSLDAYDLATKDAAGNPAPVWKTTAAVTESTGDARSLMPELLKAAAAKAGVDTKGLVHTEVPDKRPRD